MRVEILCSSRELFGSDRSGLRVAQVFRDLGHDAVLVVPRDRPERGLETLARSAGVPYRPRAMTIVSRRGAEAPAALLRSAPDPRPHLTIFNTTAAVASRPHGDVRIQVVREWLEPASLRHRVLTRLLAERSAAAVCISTGVLRQWERCTRGPVVRRVIPNWLDDEWLSRTGDVSLDGRSGLVCVGRFNQWKGQETLAAAYQAAFRGDSTRPPLTFVGAEGPDSPFHARARALRARAAASGWRLEPVTPDPSPHLLAAALLVLPSLRPEPFGNVVLEALALGCRVIAFEGGGPSDMAPEFGGALRVIPRSTAALAAELAAWGAAGAGPQSPAEYDFTRAVLTSRYGRRRGRDGWRSLTADLLGSGRA
jgi:glycosyltransferase involved in cell wall biosynthesis